MGKRPPPPPTPPRHASRFDVESGSANPSTKPSGGHSSSSFPPPDQFEYVPGTPWTPWLTPTFVAANTVVFLVSMYINNCPSSAEQPQTCLFYRYLGRFSFQPLLENPLVGPSASTLDLMGALHWKKVVVQGEGWRLFSCIWLHAGIIHLLANMFSLQCVGTRLEQDFGFVRIGTLYILSGFGGSLLSSLYLRKSISVGASGALFGFLGALLSEFITNWTIYTNKFAALSTLLFVISINLAVGLLPHVDSSAHIGGFISGCLLGFILLIRPQYGYINPKHLPPVYDADLLKPKHRPYQYFLLFISLILLIGGYIIGLFKLYHRNPNESE